MRNAGSILGLIRERGKKGLPLERVQRLLYNQDLYLKAYGKIYRNEGAMTKGVTEETVDGMSLDKIDSIIKALRTSTWIRCEVHHVRALKDLQAKGRKPKPSWMVLMIARQRKTIVVCKTCHQDIQAGRPMRRPQTNTGFMHGEQVASRRKRSNEKTL
jgi:AI2M/AI1M-like HNH endonuclease